MFFCFASILGNRSIVGRVDGHGHPCTCTLLCASRWIFFAPCSPLEKGWNSKEEVLCLSPQGCVKAHKENGVQQAVHAAEVEGAGVLALAKLDDQVDDGRPPAEEEDNDEAIRINP